MRAYYASALSENIRITPEGYLICKNVPIARTGVQEYYGEELELEQYRGQTVPVHREAADVFEPAALASFEGKPVTDEHPDEDVLSDNVSAYLKGVTTNVRQGEGENSDKVMADLIIYNKEMVAEIQGGKREISCGYNFVYDTDSDGTLFQRKIRGNHVAVVPAGRAGSEVSIKDSAPTKLIIQPERRKSQMAKTKGEKLGVFGRLFPLIAKDADPGEVQEAMQVIEEAIAAPEVADNDPAPPKAEQPPAKDEEMPPWAKALSDQVAALTAKLGAQDEDPIKKLEDELSEEATVAKPAEQIDPDNEPTPAADVDPCAAQDIDPILDAEPNAAAADSLLKLVRSMKPVIAGMTDAKEKKRATDALVSVVRGMKGIPKQRINGYTAALDAKAASVRPRAVNTADTFDLAKQQAAYDRLNPHKTKKEG